MQSSTIYLFMLSTSQEKVGNILYLIVQKKTSKDWYRLTHIFIQYKPQTSIIVQIA